MKTVINNGIVITIDNKRDEYEKVDIVIEDDTIKKVVKKYTGKYDRMIDTNEDCMLVS